LELADCWGVQKLRDRALRYQQTGGKMNDFCVAIEKKSDRPIGLASLTGRDLDLVTFQRLEMQTLEKWQDIRIGDRDYQL